jgi:hypothetical protein
VNPVSEILTELHDRGVRIELRPHGGVRLVPARLIDPDLLNRIRAHKTELLIMLRKEQEQAETNRLARADGWRPLPEPSHSAYSILETCQRCGVALLIDPATGDLVVAKAGARADEPSQPWPKLLTEIEAHLEAVARLVESGWTLHGEFPKQAAA